VRANSMTKTLLFEGEEERFRLRPDICISREGRIECIIDTKWKTLSDNAAHHGISESDIYQMFAYGKEFQAPRVVLLYPSNCHETSIKTIFHHRLDTNTPDRSREIIAATIDTTLASRQKAFSEQLRNLLARILRDETL